MIKKAILVSLVRDNLLQDRVFIELGYRQASLAQSFNRCLKRGKISGKTHHPEVLEIIKNHLNLTAEQLLD